KLRRQFLARSAGPVIQFIIAVLIIATVIFILGVLGGGGERQLKLFGLGGASGAAIFVGAVFGVIASLYLVFALLRATLGRRLAVQRLLLSVPFIGPCLRSFALARFALALRLTLDSDLPIARAARLSLQASGNDVFASRADEVVATIKQ